MATIASLSTATDAQHLEPDTADLEKALREFGDDAQGAREHRQRILQRVAEFGGVMNLPEPVMRDLRDCADRGAGYQRGSLALTERDVQALVATRESAEAGR